MVNTYLTAYAAHNVTHKYDKDQEAPHARYPKRLVRELNEEPEARDQPKTGMRQQGVAAPEALHGAIVRAHLAEP